MSVYVCVCVRALFSKFVGPSPVWLESKPKPSKAPAVSSSDSTPLHRRPLPRNADEHDAAGQKRLAPGIIATFQPLTFKCQQYQQRSQARRASMKNTGWQVPKGCPASMVHEPSSRNQALHGLLRFTKRYTCSIEHVMHKLFYLCNEKAACIRTC